PATIAGRRALALTHDKLGQALWVLGDIAGSLEHRRPAVQLLEQLVVEQPENKKLQVDLGDLTRRVGEALEISGNLSGALEQHLRAKQVFEALLASEPANLEARRGLGGVY